MRCLWVPGNAPTAAAAVALLLLLLLLLSSAQLSELLLG
jgi:hypothetical protein